MPLFIVALQFCVSFCTTKLLSVTGAQVVIWDKGALNVMNRHVQGRTTASGKDGARRSPWPRSHLLCDSSLEIGLRHKVADRLQCLRHFCHASVLNPACCEAPCSGF